MLISALLFALGEEYLTREQALRLALPEASRPRECVIELDGATRRRVEERTGGAVEPRQTVWVGDKQGAVTGYALIVTEVTKTLPATFVVGVTPAGEVFDAAVMSHEDHIGADCRRKRFVEQFRGKTAASRVSVPNGGILPVSGATLSCQAAARAVRKALAIVQYHFLDRRTAAGVRQERFLMGALLSITVEGFAEGVDRAFAEVQRLEKVLSDYDEQSELSRLNRARSIEAGDDLLEYLRLSTRFSRETGGAFDVTVAPLMRLWGFRGGKPRVPAADEVAATLKHVGWRGISIEGRRVRLDGGVELDPGAIGKGMAVDRAVAVLKQAGVKRALIDFGSSAYALGVWEMAVRNPMDREGILGTVALENESLSSSGNYEKFFMQDGRRYGHILDPRTGRPAEGAAGVSVIAPTGAESDARATAALVLGTLPGDLPAILVPPEGPAVSNEGWRRRVKKGAR